MLSFNPYGLLSEGVHKISLAEFTRLFGFNEKRKEMIKKGLIPFLKELAEKNVREVYLDGSFVTREENPDDIDGYLITDTQYPIFSFLLERHEFWADEYRVDFHPALTDFEGEYSNAWWEENFSTVLGLRAKKGYVLLEIPARGGG